MPPLPSEPHEGFIAVGRVLRPWGLAGDVKVLPLTDFPDRFDAGASLWAAGVEYVVAASRWQKGDVYLRLSGIASTEDAQRLRGVLLEVPETDVHPLPDGDFYHFQLVGLTVRIEGGDVLGTVAEVLEPGGNAVLVVTGSRGEVLIPYIEDVIRRVDLSDGEIVIDLIDGLLPEERPAARRPRRREAE
jgi:16S rRNA processing protein RimM